MFITSFIIKFLIIFIVLSILIFVRINFNNNNLEIHLNKKIDNSKRYILIAIIYFVSYIITTINPNQNKIKYNLNILDSLNILLTDNTKTGYLIIIINILFIVPIIILLNNIKFKISKIILISIIVILLKEFFQLIFGGVFDILDIIINLIPLIPLMLIIFIKQKRRIM